MTAHDVKLMVASVQLHLLAYARTLTRNDHDARDLLQDTCLRALERGTELRDETCLLAWTRAVMRNLYFERRRRWRPWVSLDSYPAGLPAELSMLDGELPVTVDEAYEGLQEFRHTLRPATRRFFDALASCRTREGVCARLGIDPKTFRMHLSRLRGEFLAAGCDPMAYHTVGMSAIYGVRPPDGHPVGPLLGHFAQNRDAYALSWTTLTMLLIALHAPSAADGRNDPAGP